MLALHVSVISNRLVSYVSEEHLQVAIVGFEIDSIGAKLKYSLQASVVQPFERPPENTLTRSLVFVAIHYTL